MSELAPRSWTGKGNNSISPPHEGIVAKENYSLTSGFILDAQPVVLDPGLCSSTGARCITQTSTLIFSLYPGFMALT